MNFYYRCQTQYDNLGDLIINKMLIEELCQYGKVYVNSTDSPVKFKKFIFENPNAIDIQKEYKYSEKKWGHTCNLLFCIKYRIKIHTHSPGAYFPFRKPERFTRIKHKLFNMLYHMNGTKFYIIGACYSTYIYSHLNFEKLKDDIYYVRSVQSQRFIKDIAAIRQSYYIPDLCYLIKNRVTSTSKRKIAIFDLRIVEGKEKQLKEWTQKIVDVFVNQGFEVIFYYQVERDYPIVESLFASIDNPAVKMRKEIVWYNDISFYSDKMFVVSNRLHSLLLGATFNVYPICMYEETMETLKLKHALSSFIENEIPIFYENGTVPTTPLIHLYNMYSQHIETLCKRNAKLCSETINSIVKKNG